MLQAPSFVHPLLMGVLRTAAEQGLGIARLPGLLAHEAIQTGRLLSLLDDQAPRLTEALVVGGLA